MDSDTSNSPPSSKDQSQDHSSNSSATTEESTKPMISVNDKDVFSRGALQLTFSLLRKKMPTLALQVRNISYSTPLGLESGGISAPESDYFKVTMDALQVRHIVETLLEIQEESIQQPEKSGTNVLAKTLTDDWVTLAQKMINESTNNTHS